LADARDAGDERARGGRLRLDRDRAGVTLSPEELERYARHIVLYEVGGAGQQRLRAARVLVVGAGGLGSPALLYLAAAGVGRLTVVDDDRVSLSNLQRQVLHGTPEVGTPKVESAARALGRLNPHVAVEALALRLDREAAAALVPGHHAVLDGSDNFATRYAVNAACVAAGVPLISAAMSQWEGQLGLFDPARGGPCYECLFPEAPDPELVPTCAQAGVIGALPGVMGSMMALEAIKLIARAGTSPRGALLIYDGLHAETRRVRIAARPDCPICGRGGGRLSPT
jgi:molybdopterin/thiamine biosynthesis adenylyltransferase